MEDWELSYKLNASMPNGCSAAPAQGIRESYRPVLELLIRQGRSNTYIARELNRRGTYGVPGGEWTWTATSVRRLRKHLGL